MSKSQRSGYAHISPFHLRVRFAPGERSLWHKVNRTASYGDEGAKFTGEGELTLHGDTLAEMLLQLAVGCARQIYRCRRLHGGRYRSTMRTSYRREEYCQ